MTILLELKEKMKKFYKKRGMYVNAVLRFALALITFLGIASIVDGKGVFAGPVSKILAAAVCAFLPVNCILLFAAAFVLLGLLYASAELALVFLLLFLIFFLLYFRFTPKSGYLFLLTVAAFILRIPYMIPLCMGLLATPVTILPVGIGVFLYQALSFVGKNTSVISATGDSQKLSYLLQGIIKNQTSFLIILAFASTIALVYLIRRMAVDHAWTIAIGVGSLCDFLILLVGKIVLDMEYSMLGLIVGTVISILLAFVINFFAFNVDYSRVERVQFEDDEYYYYVKAVPKVSISSREKKVTYINSRTEDFEDEMVQSIRQQTRGIPRSELDEIKIDD